MRIPDAIAQKRPFVSLEFFPPKKREDWPAFLQTARELAGLKPLFVSVTYGAGGSSRSNTLEICRLLAERCGFTVMPHLTGVLASPESIDRFLDEIEAIGIDNVLALRGDRPAAFTGADEELFAAFPHAADLIRHIREHSPGLAVGTAAFPEGHAEARSFSSDLKVMRDKFQSGADFGITQLFFDNRSYFDYVERLGELGVTAPVIPGILPVRSLASLRFTLKLCNARVPGTPHQRAAGCGRAGGAESGLRSRHRPRAGSGPGTLRARRAGCAPLHPQPGRHVHPPAGRFALNGVTRTRSKKTIGPKNSGPRLDKARQSCFLISFEERKFS